MKQLPFKKGDLVRFIYNDAEKDWLESQGIDVSESHVVDKCILGTSISGVEVHIENNGGHWDSTWFELDKNQIIYNIISEL